MWKIKQHSKKKTKKKRNPVLKRTTWKVWVCRSQTRLLDSYGWMIFCVWNRGFNSCNRWAGSQGNQRHQCVLKVSIWKWKACYFMGKKGVSRQVLFTAPFLTRVHNVGSTRIMCTLGKLLPLHLQAVCDGQVKWAGRKKEEKAICTTTEAGQVFLTLHSQLY